MAKAKIINPGSKFSPVTVQLTFETQDELDFMGTLFNHAGIMRVGQKFGTRSLFSTANDIEAVFEKAGAKIDRVNELGEAIEKIFKIN